MSTNDPAGSHRRRNPLTGEWVLVSAGRDQRPWRGQTERRPTDPGPQHDPECPLCPGSTRASGVVNPAYTSTFVFDNDFAALRDVDTFDPSDPASPDPLFRTEAQRGTCRVICFSPRHDRTLATMDAGSIHRVVELWCEQHRELSQDWAWVQIFENRGAEMGASNPHPHGQIWASAALPTLVSTEDQHQRRYHDDHGTALLADYAARELATGDRIVVDHDDWVVVVPFWATWPFETLLVSRHGIPGFSDLTAAHRRSLAVTLQTLLAGCDALFDRPFPYSMGWHPAPSAGPTDHWVLHAHVLPPLLRADARKFIVGYELLAENQRDITPEDAADRLRAAIASSGPAPSG